MKSKSGSLAGVIVTLCFLAVAGGVFIWSGVYNIGADAPHFKVTYALLETLREHSINNRAGKLEVPDLSDPARVTQGAGNYDAMCTGCHLSPGMAETELSKGLYPSPPNLSIEAVEIEQAFWVIKHGIKASGMPAWGKSMGDEYIWNMVAFLQKLPTMDAAQYNEMVAHSGGHSHGGGESGEHDHSHTEGDAHHHDEDAHDGDHHDAGMDDPDDDHAEHHHSDEESSAGADANQVSSDAHEHADHAAAASDKAGEVKMMTHRHADGTVESHPVKPADSATDTHTHDH